MTIKLTVASVIAAISLAGTAFAQTPAAAAAQAARVGVLADPCAATEPAPPSVAAFLAQAAKAKAANQPFPTPDPAAVKLYNEWQQRLLAADFGGLCHYDAANARLPAASNHRVVFFGDSITELWGFGAPDLFRNDIIDRGVSGQSTQQMLDRFRADVINLHPRIVHILAGTNDIAGNTGPTALAWIEANIQTMVDLAQAHHIIVILGAIPPSARFAWRPEIATVATITAYNRWIADFAARKGIVFVDYQAALDDGHGGIGAGLTADGTHPNPAGYRIMTSLAQRAIEVASKKTG